MGPPPRQQPAPDERHVWPWAPADLPALPRSASSAARKAGPPHRRNRRRQQSHATPIVRFPPWSIGMTPEQFLQHAAECERMAAFSPSHENKLVWHRMAERWTRCAELAKHGGSVVPKRTRDYVHVGTCSVYSH